MIFEKYFFIFREATNNKRTRDESTKVESARENIETIFFCINVTFAGQIQHNKLSKKFFNLNSEIFWTG